MRVSKSTAGYLFIGCLGVAGLILFRILGSSIDENGMLHEPFALVPISYVLILLGFGGAAFKFFKRS